MAMMFTPSEMSFIANFVTDLTLMGRKDDADKFDEMVVEVDRYRKEQANKLSELANCLN